MATKKLHGRAFYESIGSPKYVLAPMVDASEFAWRLLSRSFLPETSQKSLLAYSPMLHAKHFSDQIKYRNDHFKPLQPPFKLANPADLDQEKALLAENKHFLDGNPDIDRPLFVQFCANDPDVLLEAAKIVEPFCDAVDLNLGCPQGIAKRGNYGAFLQEDWDTIHRMIRKLHDNLDIPVTAKMRILETKEKTLKYAQTILDAGASIITVHGRQREQKGHNTGLADWTVIKYLRDNLSPETVMFANGNILQHDDIQKCLDATGVDGVMSAEGNLYDPTIFAPPPEPGTFEREYWRGKNGMGGWRMDAVYRRYLDIIYRHVMRQEPPVRKPLWISSDPPTFEDEEEEVDDGPRPTKKQKRAAAKNENSKHQRLEDTNLTSMQNHSFHMLRALVGKDLRVRDQLARSHAGDLATFEKALRLVERAVKEGIYEYEKDSIQFEKDNGMLEEEGDDDPESSRSAIKRCKRPYFICQPHIRPLPKEALAKGSLQLSKKEIAKLKEQEAADARNAKAIGTNKDGAVELQKTEDKQRNHAEGGSEVVTIKQPKDRPEQSSNHEKSDAIEIPKEGLVCG